MARDTADTHRLTQQRTQRLHVAPARLRRSAVRGGVYGLRLAVAALLGLAVAERPATVWADDWSDEAAAANAAIERGEAARAVDILSRLLADPALTIDAGERADLLFNRGAAHHLGGDVAAAIADYTASLAIAPNDRSALYNRGVAYAAAGKPALALADYTAAIELSGDDPQAYFNRGNVLFDLGRYGLALADYSQALRLDPSYADALANRGLLFAELGALARAASDYRAALILAPDMTEVAVRLVAVERELALSQRRTPHRVAGLAAMRSGFDSFEWRYPGEVTPDAGGLGVAAHTEPAEWGAQIAAAMRQSITLVLIADVVVPNYGTSILN